MGSRSTASARRRVGARVSTRCRACCWPTPPSASEEDCERWVDLQGPKSPDLLRAVEASDADVIAFYPYLYYPTIRGLPLVRDRAILHPAAHEEPALHLAGLRCPVRAVSWLRVPYPERAPSCGGALRRRHHAAGGSRLGDRRGRWISGVRPGRVRPRRRALSALHREGGRQEGDRDPLAVLPLLQGASSRGSPTGPGRADRRPPR